MSSFGDRKDGRKVAVLLLAYLVMAGVALAIGLISSRSVPVFHPWRWVELGSWAEPVSLACGLGLASVTIASTRLLMDRASWARELALEFRALLDGASEGQLLLLGVASGVAEELLFRGALQPLLGLVPTAIGFGLLHIGPRRSFWPWTVWAVAMGFALGLVFEVTGALSGCVLAHVSINAINLRAIALGPRGSDGDGRLAPPRLVAKRSRRG